MKKILMKKISMKNKIKKYEYNSNYKKGHHQYHRDQNKNLSGEEKQKKVEYMRNYYLAHKNNFQDSTKQFGN